MHRREVFVCMHDPDADGGRARISGRFEQIEALLRGAGIRFDLLEGAQARVTLARACDPGGSGSMSAETNVVVAGSRA